MNLARRALLVSGLIAAVAAAPAAALAGNHTVQIGGRLVAPGQLSAVEARAGPAPSTRAVQIGGAARPDRRPARRAGAAFGVRGECRHRAFDAARPDRRAACAAGATVLLRAEL